MMVLRLIIFGKFSQSLSDEGGAGGDSVHLPKTCEIGYKWRLVIAYEGTRYSGSVFLLLLSDFLWSE